jgi:hypothetical protein
MKTKRSKEKAPVEKPVDIQFAHSYDTAGINNSGEFGKLICQTLQRGERGGLRDRLSKMKRRDADINLFSGGYIVAESNAVLGEGGWTQV